MRTFFACLRFFTVLPVPKGWDGGENELRRSFLFLPFIGIILGVIVSAFDYGLGFLFPHIITTIFSVLLLICLCGALHLDGLADTADGFFSSRPKEKILKIMKDSNAGPMGITAIFFILSLKIAALSLVPSPLRFSVILLMPLSGRTAILLMHSILPYARPEGGLGSLFKSSPSFHIPWSLIIMGIVSWFVIGWGGVAMLILMLVITIIFSYFSFCKIGGMTGDTLGAISEITEIVPPLVALSLSYRGGI